MDQGKLEKTIAKAKKSINLTVNKEKLVDAEKGIESWIGELEELNEKYHSEVTIGNPLEEEKEILSKVDFRELQNSFTNEISLLTQLSKEHLKALPIPHQEEIPTLSTRFMAMFSVEYHVNGKIVGKGADTSIKKAKYIAAVSALKHLAPKIYSDFSKGEKREPASPEPNSESSEQKTPGTGSGKQSSDSGSKMLTPEEDLDEEYEKLLGEEEPGDCELDDFGLQDRPELVSKHRPLTVITTLKDRFKQYNFEEIP